MGLHIGLIRLHQPGASLITSTFSAFFSSAAFVKLKEPVMMVALSMTITLL